MRRLPLPMALDSLFEAERAQRLGTVGPVFPHLDPKFEVAAPTEQRDDLAPRRTADALETRAARADHDRLLALAIDPDHGVNEIAFAAISSFTFHFFDLDRDAVGHFLIEFEREFLANDLGDAKTQVAIRAIRLIKKLRARRDFPDVPPTPARWRETDDDRQAAG